MRTMETTNNIKLGDMVEYQTEKLYSTGVVGVVTGFAPDNRVYVLCPSGHEWMLRPSSLRILPVGRTK